MITTPLSVVTNALGGRLTDFNIRTRENMPSILKDGDHTVAIIKDESYTNLLCEAGRLREQLEIAALILDNLPGASIDTSGMRRVLADSKVEGE